MLSVKKEKRFNTWAATLHGIFRIAQDVRPACYAITTDLEFTTISHALLPVLLSIFVEVFKDRSQEEQRDLFSYQHSCMQQS